MTAAPRPTLPHRSSGCRSPGPYRRLAIGLAGAGCLAGGLAASALAAPTPRPHPTPDPYAETVVVVESSALVEPPSNRRGADAEEYLVLEGGLARRVTRVEPQAADEAWDLLVWIDGELCQPQPYGSTLLALALQSRALTALGRVRLVTAGERPEVALAGSRDERAVAEALTALSRQQPCRDRAAALLWEARRQGTREAGAAALQQLRELVARRTELLELTAGDCPGGACAVLWVGHGWPLHADLRLPAAQRSAAAREAADALAAASEALGRRLAVARRAVVALPFPPPAPEDEEEAMPPEARPGPEPLPRVDRDVPPLLRLGPPPTERRLRELPPSSWDVYVLPDLAPLRRLADATGGMVLRVPEQVGPALADLRGRLRVWYRTVPFLAGETRPLEVLIGTPPQRAQAPAWVGAAAAPTGQP